jgi:hypothetical protein
MMIKVKTVGIGPLMRDLEKLGQSKRTVEKLIVDRMSEFVFDRLKFHIRMQDLKWPPLSESWAKQKGFDYAWVWTGDLFMGFQVRKSGGKAYVGVFEDQKHKLTGVSLASIAERLEYGYGEINKKTGTVQPPRPLFRPVSQEISGRTVREIAKEVIDNVLSSSR